MKLNDLFGWATIDEFLSYKIRVEQVFIKIWDSFLATMKRESEMESRLMNEIVRLEKRIKVLELKEKEICSRIPGGSTTTMLYP